MGQMFDEIPDFLISWIEKQQLFWVATAPLSATGLINISPKGLEGTFHVVNSHKVWYEDLTGSGIETTSHLRENGRITVLFNAFEGPARIARLYGKGTTYEFGSKEYNELIPPGKRQTGSRSAIVIEIFKVGTTCGYAVPFYAFLSHRKQLISWAAKKEAVDREGDLASGFSSPPHEKGLKQYWKTDNTKSLDGLPGLLSAHESNEVFAPVSNFYREKEGSNHSSRAMRGVLGTTDYRVVVAFLLGVLSSLLYGYIV